MTKLDWAQEIGGGLLCLGIIVGIAWQSPWALLLIALVGLMS